MMLSHYAINCYKASSDGPYQFSAHAWAVPELLPAAGLPPPELAQGALPGAARSHWQTGAELPEAPPALLEVPCPTSSSTAA
jgi:hypothetical protein